MTIANNMLNAIKANQFSAHPVYNHMNRVADAYEDQAQADPMNDFLIKGGQALMNPQPGQNAIQALGNGITAGMDGYNQRSALNLESLAQSARFRQIADNTMQSISQLKEARAQKDFENSISREALGIKQQEADSHRMLAEGKIRGDMNNTPQAQAQKELEKEKYKKLHHELEDADVALERLNEQGKHIKKTGSTGLLGNGYGKGGKEYAKQTSDHIPKNYHPNLQDDKYANLGLIQHQMLEAGLKKVQIRTLQQAEAEGWPPKYTQEVLKKRRGELPSKLQQVYPETFHKFYIKDFSND